MSPLQSLVALLILVALAFSPLVFRWASRRDTSSASFSSVLTAREAVAYNLYGEAVGWDRKAMESFEESPSLRGTWLREADHALRRYYARF